MSANDPSQTFGRQICDGAALECDRLQSSAEATHEAGGGNEASPMSWTLQSSLQPMCFAYFNEALCDLLRCLCAFGEESLRPLQIGHDDLPVKARAKRGQHRVHFRDLALSTP
jgi:hypothetical protein